MAVFKGLALFLLLGSAASVEMATLQHQVDALQRQVASITEKHEQTSALLARIETLEASHIIPSRGGADVQSAALSQGRMLSSAATDDLAQVQVDAPNGKSQLLLGGEVANDNVVMAKAHSSDGGAFTIARNGTVALGVGIDGTMQVHTPLVVYDKLLSAPNVPLRIEGNGGFSVRAPSSHTVREVAGMGVWDVATIKVSIGDTVTWS